MGPASGKPPGFLRNIPARIFVFAAFAIALRSAYVVVIRGESCEVVDFCFFSLSEGFNVATSGVRKPAASTVVTLSVKAPKRIPYLWTTEGFQKSVTFYSSVFQNLMSGAVLRLNFKTLCVDTATGADVFALRKIGVYDSIGISDQGFKPMVLRGKGFKQPFGDGTFDFVFCGDAAVEKSVRPGHLAAEINRTLKPDGFLIVHTATNDTYSLHSLLDLFNFCKLVRTEIIAGFQSQTFRQIVLQKFTKEDDKFREVSGNNCSVLSYKHDLIKQAEPLIKEEPKKPWITLKNNIQKIKYLPSMVDISFKPRYVYIDVGARSYGSSIVSWFKKKYPKQNKKFEIYAIEADRAFHGQYESKKGVTLLPYAAWVRNESLFFEINDGGPGGKNASKGRGMGRIKPVEWSGGADLGSVDRIQGFDFAEWVKKTVRERDYVVMKMDVEGTEFDLIPRMFETGAICLIDELLLECHYNRWQKCCRGERTGKYKKTYGQCVDLFTSLRERGVLVHQWW